MDFSFWFLLIPLGILFTAVYGLFIAVQFVRRKFGWIPPKTDTVEPIKISENPFVLPAFFWFAALVLIIGFNIGLYDAVSTQKIPTVGLAIFQLCAGAGWLLLFSKKKISPAVITLVTSSILSGLFLTFRANGFVQSFNGVVWTMSTLGLFALFVRAHTRWSFLGLLQTLAQMIPASFSQSLLLIGAVFAVRENKRSQVFGWIKTAGIAIAVFLFFVGILSQSDPVFNEMIKSFREQLFGRALQSAVLLLVAGATLSVVLPKQSDEPWRLRFLSYRDSVAALVTTLLVIGLFLFVQFRYLFGGSRELLVALDLTFSEYVRKGFIELLVATFAGGILVYLMTLKQRALEVGQAATIKIMSTALVIELFLLLSSALKRDLLYMDTYGLTRVRIVGGLFLIWLAGLLLSLLFFVIWKRMRELNLLRAVWGLSLFVWLALNILNVDLLVAQGGPEHHDYTDYYYLANLSEDAVREWPAMITAIETNTNRLLEKQNLTSVEKAELAGLKLSLVAVMERRDLLYMQQADQDWVMAHYDQLRVDDIYHTNWRDSAYSQNASTADKTLPKQLLTDRGWRFYNSAEKNAFQLLQKNEALFFDTVNTTFEKIQLYQLRNQVSLYEHEDRLLSEFSYPFISIHLRYRAENLSDTEIKYGSKDVIDKNKHLISSLELNQGYTVGNLQTLECSAIPSLQKPIVVYGELRTVPNEITLSLDSLTDLNARLTVTPAQPVEKGVLARIELTPIQTTTAAGCTVTYRLENASPLKLLSNGR